MTTLLIGLLIPLLGTMLGASFVFFMKRDMPELLFDSFFVTNFSILCDQNLGKNVIISKVF